MNVYELDTVTLDLLYEDVTDENRAARAPGFLRAYNRAYDEMQRARYRPRRWEQAQATDDTLALASLSYCCRAILKIARFRDYSQEAGGGASPGLVFRPVDHSAVALPGAGADSVWVLYEYRYPDLKNDAPCSPPAEETPENTPQIPCEAHPLLCIAAAADCCRRRRRPDLSDMHMREYYRALATLRPVPMPGGGLRNLYERRRG